MKWISGFWRRIGALLVDSVILGSVGFGLGLALEKQFVELGGWGRFVGFFIALVYFGVLNSRVFGGQTFGKKLFDIRVVNSDNQTIDIFRSFARYSILGIPLSLNGAHFTNEAIVSIWIYPLSFVIFGGLVSVAYLYIFNRTTRQSLHDLIVGTFVVNTNVEKQDVGTVWRPHLVVVGALFVIAAIGPIFTSHLAQSQPFRELLSAQAELIKNPSVSYATVSYGKSSFSSSNEGAKTTTYISAQAFLKKDTVADVELARQLAEIIASNYSESLQKDVVQINLTYGYDIGISSQWSSHAHNFSPKELVIRD
jgi:uncharacterized RDD family membrane protein YckC